MRNITFVKPIASASGKICTGSDMYLRTNPVTGKSHTGKLQHPYKGPASAKQAVCRERFRQVMAIVKQRLQNPVIKAQLEQEFRAQHKIGTLVGFAYNKYKYEVL